jgi:hypothetical protein
MFNIDKAKNGTRKAAIKQLPHAHKILINRWMWSFGVMKEKGNS